MVTEELFTEPFLLSESEKNVLMRDETLMLGKYSYVPLERLHTVLDDTETLRDILLSTPLLALRQPAATHVYVRAEWLRNYDGIDLPTDDSCLEAKMAGAKLYVSGYFDAEPYGPGFRRTTRKYFPAQSFSILFDQDMTPLLDEVASLLDLRCGQQYYFEPEVVAKAKCQGLEPVTPLVKPTERRRNLPARRWSEILGVPLQLLGNSPKLHYEDVQRIINADEHLRPDENAPLVYGKGTRNLANFYEHRSLHPQFSDEFIESRLFDNHRITINEVRVRVAVLR